MFSLQSRLREGDTGVSSKQDLIRTRGLEMTLLGPDCHGIRFECSLSLCHIRGILLDQ